jgi:hypothetical protein
VKRIILLIQYLQVFVQKNSPNFQNNGLYLKLKPNAKAKPISIFDKWENFYAVIVSLEEYL